MFRIHRTSKPRLMSWLLPAVFGTTIALGLAATGRGQEVQNGSTLPAGDPAPAAPVHAYTLEECIQEGLGNQAALRAAQASAAGAQAQVDALNNLRLIGAISPEIPIRRKQAALGVVIANAEVNKVEWDTVYGITRNYFSAVFAHKQEQVIRKMIENLIEKRSFAVNAIKADPLKVNQADIDRLSVYIDLAKAKLAEATEGVNRAKAALREAMGMPQCNVLFLAEGELPALQEGLCKEQLIELALARRGEMIKAGTAVEVFCLEVAAQQANHKTVVPTFASGGDIHATTVPQGVSNGEYRPWAVGIEMPVTLVGHKADRVRRTQDYRAKAVAVADKTQQLISLEAAEAFHKWKEAAKKLEILGKTPEVTAKLLKSASAKFELDPKTAENLLNTQVLDAQVHASYNEALYQHALALAALERITAGGFAPAYRRVVVATHP